MTPFIDVVTRGAPDPDEAREQVLAHADRLDRYADRIQRCRVTVEGPGGHHQKGFWAVRVDLSVPGKELVVSRQKGEYLGEALIGAFGAAARLVQDHFRRRRG
jgi:hypothetical protein